MIGCGIVPSCKPFFKGFKVALGFTLVEVLVALGIFAVLSTGYLIVTGDSIRGLGQLQDKIFALWIAEDTVTRMRTFDANATGNFREQKVEFLERSWIVSFKKEATEVKSLSRVTLSVALAEDSEYPLSNLETYFYEGPFVPQNVQQDPAQGSQQ
jgi:general secretion pathway protein I